MMHTLIDWYWQRLRMSRGSSRCRLGNTRRNHTDTLIGDLRRRTGIVDEVSIDDG